MTQDDPKSTASFPTDQRLPGLMGSYTDDELNQHVIDHAKYFTVVQVNRGGFVGGGKNYDRHQVDTLEEARVLAADLYKSDPGKRGIIIYAVADFAGANGFSRPVENYPKSTWESKSQKADREKKERALAREKAREARKTTGKPSVAKRSSVPSQTPAGLPEGFMDDPQPMVYIED